MMTDSKRHSLWLFASILHLTLVALSACYVVLPHKNGFWKVLDFYEKASGSDSSYGFFAPSIGNKSRIRFDVFDKDQRVLVKDLELSPEMNREETIRLGGIFDEYTSEDAEEEEFRRNLGSSLAASVFGRYPEARALNLRVEEFVHVSMEEFRSGKRAQWEQIYQASFSVITTPKAAERGR